MTAGWVIKVDYSMVTFENFTRLYISPLLHLSESLANVCCSWCYDGMWKNGSGAWM